MAWVVLVATTTTTTSNKGSSSSSSSSSSGMNVVPWNESEIEKLDVGQNRVARMALNAPRYAAVEALRGDMGWSTFRERYMKATLRYKVRLERMEDTRLARKVYLWSERNSRWMKRCMRMVDRSNMQIIWTYGRSERRQGEYDSGEGNELDLRKWEKVIDH